MTVLRALFERRSFEDPAKPRTDASIADWLGGAPTEAGVPVTPKTALGFSAVFRAIALLSGLVGSLPIQSFKKSTDGRRERTESRLIEEPHPDLTPFEVWEQAGMGLFGQGNSYTHKVRDGLGVIRELWPLLPQHMRVERRSEWRTDVNPTGKRFFYTDGGREIVYTPFEVMHIPGLSYDGLTGLSPIGLARQGISLALAAERFGARMFNRAPLVPGILTSDEEIEEGPAKILQRRFAEVSAGPGNQWRVPVLGGGAKFQPINLPADDVQFLESRAFAIEEQARWYGLPPHLLGSMAKSTSWGTGIEQQNLQMLVFTADPWFCRIEQRATKELAAPGEYFKINRRALLRADTATRFMAYARAVSNGWQNADEVRELEDMDPLPNGLGQTFYRPGNVVPVVKGPGSGGTTEASVRELTEMVQKVYLGVGKVLTSEEARELLNRAGAGFTAPWLLEDEEDDDGIA